MNLIQNTLWRQTFAGLENVTNKKAKYTKVAKHCKREVYDTSSNVRNRRALFLFSLLIGNIRVVSYSWRKALAILSDDLKNFIYYQMRRPFTAWWRPGCNPGTAPSSGSSMQSLPLKLCRWPQKHSPEGQWRPWSQETPLPSPCLVPTSSPSAAPGGVHSCVLSCLVMSDSLWPYGL